MMAMDCAFFVSNPIFIEPQEKGRKIEDSNHYNHYYFSCPEPVHRRPMPWRDHR
jgi:hypothetical protein